MEAQRWMMHYGVAAALALCFGIILGQVPLFRETSVGTLRASDLVQFISYSGSVAIVWLGARDMARNPPAEWQWIKPVRGVIVPLVTLLSVGIVYGALLLILGPFLGKTGKAMYNWIFITAIVSNGIWLIVCWVQKCAPLVAATETPKIRKAA